jgi:hypothetical protein
MPESITDLDKAHDQIETSEIPEHIPISSEKPIQFQIFFLAHDQNQGVEVVETDEIDCREIIQHLRMGKSIFIHHKNPQTFEHSSKLEMEKKQDP